MTDAAADRPALPDALMPAIVDACRLALEHTGEDGRLMYAPGEFTYLHNTRGIAALAVAYTSEHPDNPLHGDAALADLIRRAGRFMVRHHLDPENSPPGHMWYEGREIHEWPYELWLAAYRVLKDAGADDLVEGWEEGLRAGGEVFQRWIPEIAHLRTASSPNFNISPNHFAFFILNALETAILFDNPAARDAALERARWITGQQHPDGYWAETDGPTTSYNFITTAAVGGYYRLTGERVFLDALRRALDFHTRYLYPDGTFLETIDQRIRYREHPVENWAWTLYAFSLFPEGRALNEYVARKMDYFRRPKAVPRVGRLAKAFVNYQSGEVAPQPEAITHGAFRLSRPGGIVKDGTWAVGLSGLNSRPRPHRYTMDRMNCLSVWHADTGLIIGGGNARNQPEAATFHKRVRIDPQATPEGLTHMDVCTPVTGSLDLTEKGGTLRVGYWGFDGEIAAEIVDARRLRLTVGAWARNDQAPIQFTPNLRLLPDVPLVTAAGREIAIDGTAFELTADEMGDWVGQGAWRLSVPPNATLIYPYRPRTSREPDAVPVADMYALLTVPLANEAVILEVTVKATRPS